MHLDETLVRRLLSDQFPQLALDRIITIDEGEGRTFEVDGALIFRFPVDDAGAAKLAREACLLGAIGGDLPVPVPQPEYQGRAAADFPYSFAGHRKIAGRSAEAARPERRHWPALGRQLGECFSALHAEPVATGERCGLPRETMQDPAALLESTRGYAGTLRRHAADLINPRMERYLDGDVEVPSPSPPDLFVCHGDVKGEHLLLSDERDRVVGLIDWSDCCLSDRLLDFAGLVIWLGPAFLEIVLAHYTIPTDRDFFDRVCFYARCFALGNLGERLEGRSDAPLPLLRTQLGWAFAR